MRKGYKSKRGKARARKRLGRKGGTRDSARLWVGAAGLGLLSGRTY